MAQSVTVESTASDGKVHHITLEKTGADTGTVRLRTWYSAGLAGQARPDEERSYKLVRIRAAVDGEMIKCKVDLPTPSFLDPNATITALPGGNGGRPKVSLALSGVLSMNIEREVSAEEVAAVTAFIIEAGFPPIG